MTVDVFAVPVFVVVFRETFETVIIVSILLAFLKQTLDGPERDPRVYKKLLKQVWLGTGLGFLICLIIAAGIIGAFYTVGINHWEGSELKYEGAFCLIASIIITIVGAALLRIGKMQDKWRVKIAAAVEAPLGRMTGNWSWFKRFCEKYALFILPFITVLREGVEAIIFIAGVSFSAPGTAVPLPVFVGLIVGIVAGYILYKSGASSKLQFFLVASTCLLYLVAAGLFSRAVHNFEDQEWINIVGSDADELGDGPGSYDIDKSVWHVNCCSPDTDGGGGWGIFNSLFGWDNSATVGSVLAYNLYWLVVIAGFLAMRYHEVKGHWPLMKPKEVVLQRESSSEGETKAANATLEKVA